MKRVILSMCAGIAMMLVGCGVETGETESPAASSSVETTQQPLVLEITYDQCSDVLKVLNSNDTFVTIQRGVVTRVNLASARFMWLCGGSTEYTTCAPGTSSVDVYHSTTSRQITWWCND